MIRQDKTYQVESNMQSGQAFGMHTLNMDLIRLVEAGKITEEVAIHCSSSPSSLPFSLPEPKEEESFITYNPNSNRREFHTIRNEVLQILQHLIHQNSLFPFANSFTALSKSDSIGCVLLKISYS